MKRERIDSLSLPEDRFEEHLKELRKLSEYWTHEAESYSRAESPRAVPVKAERCKRIASTLQQTLETKHALHVLSVADILKAPPVSWQIEGVLPDAVLSILAGYTGIGKSLLALSLAGAIATGRPLFGQFKINRPGPVLVVDEENSRSLLRDRLTAARLQDAPIFFLSFSGVLLDEPKSFGRLLEAIAEVKPAQIFFDSLIRVHRANENEASEMARVMGKLREIVNLGIGVMALHHHTKSKNSLEVRARGSSDIIGGADLELALVKNSDALELHTVKTRWLKPDPMSLKIETRAGGAVINYLGTVEPHCDHKRREEVILNAETPATIREILERLKEADLPISERRLRPVLKEMVEAGKLKESVRSDNKTRLYAARF